MSDISIVSLVLAIVALLISIYSFLKVMMSPSSEARVQEPQTDAMPPEKREEKSEKIPQTVQKEIPNMGRDDDLRAQVKRFSVMVAKNLEQLNTRVGVKGNVKPVDLSNETPDDRGNPNVVDSEVSDQ